MADLITAQRTYATRENAVKALDSKLARAGLHVDTERWLIAVNAAGRFVPVLVGERYIRFAHDGIMVVG